jgi:hypothetical protein
MGMNGFPRSTGGVSMVETNFVNTVPFFALGWGGACRVQ